MTGCIVTLGQAHYEGHPLVRRLRDALRRWRRGLSFWEKVRSALGGDVARPVELDFPRATCDRPGPACSSGGNEAPASGAACQRWINSASRRCWSAVNRASGSRGWTTTSVVVVAPPR